MIGNKSICPDPLSDDRSIELFDCSDALGILYAPPGSSPDGANTDLPRIGMHIQSKNTTVNQIAGNRLLPVHLQWYLRETLPTIQSWPA
jgi:hypothetical protein